MKHLPNRASILIATAATFFAIGHAATGTSGSILHLQAVAGNIRHVYAGGAVESIATCPAGTLAVSGGWAPASQSTDNLGLYLAKPVGNLHKWAAFIYDSTAQGSGDGNATVEAFAVCGSVAP